MKRMNISQEQRAFDLLASLVELNARDESSNPVWDAAKNLCNEFRAKGFERHRYLEDYYFIY